MAYTRVYKDFRGVDVSSEASEVNEKRFAHAVNVWRDYHNENGEAVETAPGFRVLSTLAGEVNAMHYLPAVGAYTAKLLVHRGTKMYSHDIGANTALSNGTELSGVWADAPSNSVYHYGKLYIVDGEHYRSIKNGTIPEVKDATEGAYIPTTFSGGDPYEQRNMLTSAFIETYVATGSEEKIYIGDLVPNDTRRLVALFSNNITLYKYYHAKEDEYFHHLGANKYFAVFYDENENVVNESSFEWADEDEYRGYDLVVSEGRVKITEHLEDYYIPWYYYKKSNKYLPLIDTGIAEFEDSGAYTDSVGWGYDTVGTSKVISYIKLKEKLEEGTTITIEGYADASKFVSAGELKDVLTGNPDFTEDNSAEDAILGCTLITEFDGRLFLSGNPNLPNSVFYTQRRADTGLNDPSYIGAYNYLNDGTGDTPITAMMTTTTNLIVMKDDVAQGSSAYYHTGEYNPSEDPITANLQPRVYPSVEGIAGVGCLGAAVNFRDDPVFLSSRGLEFCGKSQVNMERSIGHRSYLVDAKLINENLRGARFAEWDGYLAILVPGGRIYLADSRQIDSSLHGDRQYEWYLLEGIGMHTAKAPRYRYASSFPEGVTAGAKYNGIDIGISPDKNGEYIEGAVVDITVKDAADKNVALKAIYEEAEDGVYYYYLAECYGELQTTKESKFANATALLALDDLLFFGCSDGTVCLFNTDERDASHKIMPKGYIRERTGDKESGYTGMGYVAEMATKSDHCGRTNVAKSTEKGTFILKAKSYPTSKIAVKVRTNTDTWTTVYDGAVSQFNFGEIDFSSAAFGANDSFMISINERKRKWVEKQIWVEGWCFGSPFGLINVTYDFIVAGKVKLR